MMILLTATCLLFALNGASALARTNSSTINILNNDATIPKNIVSATDCKCKFNADNRIVGGQETIAHKVPWQISLAQWGQHICGGTILNRFWILTAAHCVNNAYKNTLSVRVGLHYLNDRDIASKTYAVQDVIIHGHYNSPNHQITDSGDMALLRLARPIRFNKYVQPACLPSFFQHYSDTPGSLLATGWGSIRSTVQKPGGGLGNTVISNVLKEAQFNYVNPNDPKSLRLLNTYANQVPGECVKSYTVCIKPVRSGDSVCNGDSGGPIHHTYNGLVRVVGVASYVLGGNINNLTTYCIGQGAYSRVTSYLTFLRYYIGNDYCTA